MNSYLYFGITRESISIKKLQNRFPLELTLGLTQGREGQK